MMEEHWLTGPEGTCRVGAAFVVAELNFEHAGSENFHYCTYLATLEAACREIL
jgi:hypothetical protein